MALQQHTVRIHSVASPNVLKSEIAGRFGGVKVELIEGFEFGKTNKTEEFLKLNPNGQVPTAITNDGPLWESNAIAYYVARIGSDAKGLLGETPYQQAVIDQWVNFSRSRLENLYALFAFTMGYGKYEQPKWEEAHKKLTDAFTVVEKHLHHTGNKFLTGNRLTLADIIFLSQIVGCLRVSITKDALKPFPKTHALIDAILKEEHVHSCTGPVNIPETFTPPAQ